MEERSPVINQLNSYMNLNKPGSGRKLVNIVSASGSINKLGWSREQQREFLDKQKNPHNPKSRPRNPK